MTHRDPCHISDDPREPDDAIPGLDDLDMPAEDLEYERARQSAIDDAEPINDRLRKLLANAFYGDDANFVRWPAERVAAKTPPLNSQQSLDLLLDSQFQYDSGFLGTHIFNNGSFESFLEVAISNKASATWSHQQLQISLHNWEVEVNSEALNRKHTSNRQQQNPLSHGLSSSQIGNLENSSFLLICPSRYGIQPLPSNGYSQ